MIYSLTLPLHEKQISHPGRRMKVSGLSLGHSWHQVWWHRRCADSPTVYFIICYIITASDSIWDLCYLCIWMYLKYVFAHSACNSGIIGNGPKSTQCTTVLWTKGEKKKMQTVSKRSFCENGGNNPPMFVVSRFVGPTRCERNLIEKSFFVKFCESNSLLSFRQQSN